MECACGATAMQNGRAVDGRGEHLCEWADGGVRRVFCSLCGERFEEGGAAAAGRPAAHDPFDTPQGQEDSPDAVEERKARAVAAKLAPPLEYSRAKGDSGRIGVWGGCDTLAAGAPVFASLAVLRSGGEAVYTLAPREACAGIAGHSPELTVVPLYSMERLETPVLADTEVAAIVKVFGTMAVKFHALVVGPGLGVSHALGNPLRAVLLLVAALGRQMPVVLDGDALHHLAKNPEVVSGVSQCVITPNAREAKLFFPEDGTGKKRSSTEVAKELARRLKVVVVLKGATDVISDGETTLHCGVEGAPRRCGGLGDVLSGVLAVFLGWRMAESKHYAVSILEACHAACAFVRAATREAYRKRRRAMSAMDVLDAAVAMTDIYYPPMTVDDDLDL